MQESASFWTDIKILEEQLSKSPDSFCFARLSEVYLKVGLIDDALQVARRGVMKRPFYLSGQKALALASHAKGLNEEALTALKLVTEALPEDMPSQKLLGHLYAETGNQIAACQTFRTALEFAPDDVECRIELESLERSGVVTEYDADEEIIEDLEILEDLDIVGEGQPESKSLDQKVYTESESAAVPFHDPLSTGTLAELYVTQGFIHKALEIYRAIQTDNPADQAVAKRITELEALETAASELNYEIDNTDEAEYGDESTFSKPAEAFIQAIAPEVLFEPYGVPVLESRNISAAAVGLEMGASSVPLQGVADNSLSTLEGWLDNIRRIKSCH